MKIVLNKERVDQTLYIYIYIRFGSQIMGRVETEFYYMKVSFN